MRAVSSVSSCLSYHLCPCISNLLGAMGKMLILVTLCNYSEVNGVNACVQHFSNQNLALCCLNVLNVTKPNLPVNSIFNLCGFCGNATGGIILRPCFKIGYSIRVINVAMCEQFPGLSGSDTALQFHGPQLVLCSLQECCITIFILNS